MDKKDYRLKGHESFTLREGWLTKGLNAVHENPRVFSENSGADALGVGTNMAKSIRYWMRTAELTKEHPRDGVTLTEYGNLIFQNDPYFEDIFSLWVIHANIARNFKLATSWNIFFNNIDVTSFKREELINMMTENIINITGDTMPPERSIADDCAAILQMYTENGDVPSDPEEKRISPFAALGFLSKVDSNTFEKKHPARDLIDPSLILYVIADKIREENVLSIDDIVSGNNMPGKVFYLNRVSINEYALGFLVPVNGSIYSLMLIWSLILSSSSWFCIYAFIAFLFLPTVSTKYLLAQKCRFPYLYFRLACRSNIIRLLFPFR